jgi:hypothetical protein
MDFLGMPVRLAPSLGGKPALADEVAVRGGAGGSAQTVRPNDFTSLRSKLFPSFHSIHAEPDKHAWEQAAPRFGLRDSKPTTLLAPDARVPLSHSVSGLLPNAKGGAGSMSLGAALSHSLGANPAGSSARHIPLSPLNRPRLGQNGSAGYFSPHANFAEGNHGGSPINGQAWSRSSHSKYPGSISMTRGRQHEPGFAAYSGASMPVAPLSTFGGISPGVTNFTSPFTPEASKGQRHGSSLSQPPFASVHPSFNTIGGPAMGGLGSRDHTHFGSGSTPFSAPSSPGYVNSPGGSYSPSTTAGAFSRGLCPMAAHGHASSGSAGGFSASAPSFAAGPSFPRRSSSQSVPEPAGGTLFVWPAATPGSSGRPDRGSQYRVSPRSLPMLLRQTDTFAPMQSSAPAHSFTSAPSQSSSVLWERAPKRNYTLPAAKPHARATPDTMTIQRVVTGSNSASITNTQPPTQAHRQTSQSAHDNGQAPSEVNLLANEVWSLLKRRISAEADRRGRW